MSSDIVLTVDDGQPADAARFFAVGTHLLDLLDDLADTSDVEWSVADLRRASAVAGLEATGEYREAGLMAVRSANDAKDLVRRAGAHVISAERVRNEHVRDTIRA